MSLNVINMLIHQSYTLTTIRVSNHQVLDPPILTQRILSTLTQRAYVAPTQIVTFIPTQRIFFPISKLIVDHYKTIIDP